MKKLSVWALLAILVVAGSAFAAPRVAPNATFSFGGPTTTNNDDSCDISTAPAATLLLPFFEVDIAAAAGVGENTLFTITNVSNLPQVAHVTLWTDWSFPVIDFNIYLTGYDVQSISMYDIIVRGQIAPTAGTGAGISPVGELSGDPVTDTDNDNPVVNEASCFPSAAPVQLTQPYITRMQQAFTQGRIPAGIPVGSGACINIGATHTNAIGYATVDVAGNCSTSLPTDPLYFASEIRFDNVLIGDYQQVNGGQNFAQGNPMVHIRAIPEGGLPTDVVTVNFDRTFYGRYQPALTPTRDRRQPLPAVFAARWIQGSADAFQTFYKIWREGRTGATSACSPSGGSFPLNAQMGVTEIVRFDEEENPEGFTPPGQVSPPLETDVRLPETSITSVADPLFYPPNPGGDVSGWMYLNLNSQAPEIPAGIASQNWVIVSMRAQGRFSVDFDAAWLGNGCGPEIAPSEATTGTEPIGPSPNQTPNL